MNPIEAEKLTRRFGDTLADDAVSFFVRPGETYGLLGPNGAGKTTLVRMLTTLLPPTSGTARVAGHDIVSQKGKVRASIGTVSQAEELKEALGALEGLRSVARPGVPYREYAPRVSDAKLVVDPGGRAVRR